MDDVCIGKQISKCTISSGVHALYEFPTGKVSLCCLPKMKLLSPKITSRFFIILGDRFESKNLFFKFFRVDTKVLDRSAKSNFWFN